MSAIRLSGLRVGYRGGAPAIDDVDLDIADGEFVALVGPSGSGKTTLLRTIAGFLSPASGTVSIGGRVVAGERVSVPPERRRIGMVFQQHAIWPHWTIAKNVGYPLKLAGAGREERRRRVADVLALVGLAGFEARDPATLSGGQRQRVALARALAASPDVLLLDEALSALDEPLRARLRSDLKALTSALGLTVVHVTHDRAEALALADRVVVLDHGRIRQAGTPEELVRSPRSAFVASFLSDAAVLPGTLDGDGFAADGLPLTVPLAAIRGTAESGPGRVAILPDDVEVAESATGDGDLARVVSSLYGRERHELIVEWRGARLHATATGRRPETGEHVALRLRSALFFPGNVGGDAGDDVSEGARAGRVTRRPADAA